MTAQDLADLWEIPVGTVWRWASEDSWPRTRTHPRRYDPEAADESRLRRMAHRAETLANLELHRQRHGASS